MASEDREHDTGSKDRATVALVDAKVGEVSAKVDGIGNLMRAEFGYIRERIEPLAGVVRQVSLLRAQADDHERRLEALEGDRKSDRDWRRVNLPSLVIAGTVAIGSIVGLITQIH